MMMMIMKIHVPREEKMLIEFRDRYYGHGEERGIEESSLSYVPELPTGP